MEKEKRIKAEKTRLLELFKDLDENELQTAIGLINSAAFMAVSLEDLEGIINSAGYFDEYQNGENQHGTKISAAVQAYNNMAGKYTTLINRLLQIVPRVKKPATTTAVHNHKENTTDKFLQNQKKREMEAAFMDAVRDGKVKQTEYKEFCNKWEAD